MCPRTYACRFIDRDIQIDADLTKPEWAIAEWSEPFVDIEGDAKAPPPLETRVKMLWNSEFLYIAAQLEEPHLWATLLERDSVIFHDNDFEVFIDPDGDSHHYVELEINALNTVWDLVLPKPYKDSGMPLTSWRIRGLQTAVRLEGTLNDPSDVDKGWSLEIAIPFESIREVSRNSCPPQPGDMWRINFSRVQWDLDILNGAYQKTPGHPEHNWVWSPQGVVDMHRPECWGLLHFTEDGSVKADKELCPPILHEAYYAMHAFRRTTGRWPRDPQELNVRHPNLGLYTTPSLFELTMRSSSGTLWHISSDALVWESSPETDNIAG